MTAKFDEKTVTQSSLTTFLECRYRYYLKYIKCYRGLSAEEPVYFLMGRAFHKFMETGSMDVNMDGIEEVEQARLRGVMAAYEAFYGTYCSSDEFEAEKFFQFQYADFNICGIADLVTDNTVVDHKLVSQIQSSYINSLEASPQLIYLYAFKRNVFTYNIVVKPSIKWKEAKGQTLEQFRDEVEQKMLDAPEKHFLRHDIHVSAARVHAMKCYFSENITKIARCMDYNDWPKNITSCVNRYGQPCQFFNACHGADEEYELRTNFVEDDTIRHSELKAKFQKEELEDEPFAD